MNILFLNINAPSITTGGIEKVTYLLAEYFESYYHIRCFHAFSEKCYSENHFVITPETTLRKFAGFIQDKHIDIIINNWPERYSKLMEKILAQLDCKYIVCYHSTPFFSEKMWILELKGRVNKIWNRQHFNFKYFVKTIYFPLTSFLQWDRTRRASKRNYKLCDKYILLSRFYIEDTVRELSLKDASKLLAINNPLVFHRPLPELKLQAKEKIVLIVARLVPSKRIDLALKVWKQVEYELPDWHLVIVGHGSEEENLKAYANKLGLSRVSFEGRQESEAYFEKASLFLMTSIVEGWPLTLIEALQKGCVPVVMEAKYKSLPEIIINNDNGYITPKEDISICSQKLVLLCRDDQLRTKMAINAIHSVERFSMDKIALKWINLFNELYNKHK